MPACQEGRAACSRAAAGSTAAALTPRRASIPLALAWGSGAAPACLGDGIENALCLAQPIGGLCLVAKATLVSQRWEGGAGYIRGWRSLLGAGLAGAACMVQALEWGEEEPPPLKAIHSLGRFMGRICLNAF